MRPWPRRELRSNWVHGAGGGGSSCGSTDTPLERNAAQGEAKLDPCAPRGTAVLDFGRTPPPGNTFFIQYVKLQKNEYFAGYVLNRNKFVGDILCYLSKL